MHDDIRNSKIGLIAGNGDLPEKIITECIKSKRDIFVISIGDNQSPSLLKVPHVILGIGAVGKAIRTLRKENVKHIVFAGGIKRPKFSALRPDAGGVKLLAKISKSKLLGDNSLLSIVIKFFESSGFTILGAEEIMGDLLMTKGILGKIEPNGSALKEIDFGVDIARAIGRLDIGQSVIVKQGMVVGVEAAEGTDELIKRCGKLLKDDEKAILVKMKKPNQDKRIDLPTIGVTTVENAYRSGLRGMALEAGSAFILDRKEVIRKADELGIFIVGV